MFGGLNATEGAVVTLKELDVPSMGGRRHCDHKVIHVGEDQASVNAWVEGGNVDDEQRGAHGRYLWGTLGDWWEFLGGASKEEPALSGGEETGHPRDHVPVCPFGP